MEIENRFEFPDKEDSLTLHQGLEAMLAARKFFSKKGMASKVESDCQFNSNFPIRDQGIYVQYRDWDLGDWSKGGKIIFKDSVTLSSKEFASYSNIDQLIQEIIDRYGHFEDETPKRGVAISTFMGDKNGYNAMFILDAQPRKGFLATGYNINRWGLLIQLKLYKPLITKDEAEEYGMIKREFEELLGDGLGISQEEIQYNRRR